MTYGVLRFWAFARKMNLFPSQHLFLLKSCKNSKKKVTFMTSGVLRFYTFFHGKSTSFPLYTFFLLKSSKTRKKYKKKV